jgi:hypothetical protein
MQNLVSREVPAQETAVLTIGQLVSGTKSNIIPDRAFMTGTLRAFDEGVRRQILSRLEDYVSHIGQAYRTQATLKVDLGSCPTVVNHQAETDFMLRAAALELGEEAVGAGKLVMASDDMSLFLQARPGCYFRVGIGQSDGRSRPHHAPEFEMNEAGLPQASASLLGVMLEPSPAKAPPAGRAQPQATPAGERLTIVRRARGRGATRPKAVLRATTKMAPKGPAAGGAPGSRGEPLALTRGRGRQRSQMALRPPDLAVDTDASTSRPRRSYASMRLAAAGRGRLLEEGRA